MSSAPPHFIDHFFLLFLPAACFERSIFACCLFFSCWKVTVNEERKIQRHCSQYDIPSGMLMVKSICLIISRIVQSLELRDVWDSQQSSVITGQKAKSRRTVHKLGAPLEGYEIIFLICWMFEGFSFYGWNPRHFPRWDLTLWKVTFLFHDVSLILDFNLLPRNRKSFKFLKMNQSV